MNSYSSVLSVPMFSFDPKCKLSSGSMITVVVENVYSVGDKDGLGVFSFDEFDN